MNIQNGDIPDQPQVTFRALADWFACQIREDDIQYSWRTIYHYFHNFHDFTVNKSFSIDYSQNSKLAKMQRKGLFRQKKHEFCHLHGLGEPYPTFQVCGKTKISLLLSSEKLYFSKGTKR